MSFNRIDNSDKIELVREEILKNIEELKSVIKKCSLGELYYYISSLHFKRNFNYFNKNNSADDIALFNRFSDIVMYAIPILYKYNKDNYISDIDNDSISINYQFIEEITETINIINRKFESISMLKLFPIHSFNKIDKQIAIDISSLVDDQKVKRINDYFVRVQVGLEIEMIDKTIDIILKEFAFEFAPYKRIFQSIFNVSVNDTLNFFLKLVEAQNLKFQIYERNFFYDKEGFIDVANPNNLILYADKILRISKKEIHLYSCKLNTLLDSLTFRPDNFTDRELRFLDLYSNPILDLGNDYLINLEFVFGGLKKSIHYQILKSSFGDEYQKIMSDTFVNTLVDIANTYGYEEVEREYELFEKKGKSIGDIDLILQNIDSKEFLLIEAKCHTLVLDVQAHDPEMALKKLDEQKIKWENKVQKRIDYINKDKSLYFGENYKYIIVSKKPEILSHFSEITVFSLEEFKFWLKSNESLSFDKVFQSMYNNQLLKPSTIKELYGNTIYGKRK